MPECGSSDQRLQRIELANIVERQLVADECAAVDHGAQRRRALSEGQELGCMRVQDRHHVRPCFVDLAVDVDFLIFVSPRARDGFAVEIVLNDVAGLHDARGHVPRNEVVIGIPWIAHADVPERIQNSQFLRRQHPVGGNQVADDGLVWRDSLRRSRIRAWNPVRTGDAGHDKLFPVFPAALAARPAPCAARRPWRGCSAGDPAGRPAWHDGLLHRRRGGRRLCSIG